MIRRVPALLIATVLCLQAMFVGAVAPPKVPAARAAEPGCTLSISSGGGTLSACPDADTYDDFAADLGVAFDGLRGQGATSGLSVSSTPDGASVLLNGLPAGLTPLETSVAAGSYLVRLERDGFAPYSTTVNVAADRPGNVTATLEPVTTNLGSFNWLRAADFDRPSWWVCRRPSVRIELRARSRRRLLGRLRELCRPAIHPRRADRRAILPARASGASLPAEGERRRAFGRRWGDLDGRAQLARQLLGARLDERQVHRQPVGPRGKWL